MARGDKNVSWSMRGGMRDVVRRRGKIKETKKEKVKIEKEILGTRTQENEIVYIVNSFRNEMGEEGDFQNRLSLMVRKRRKLLGCFFAKKGIKSC